MSIQFVLESKDKNVSATLQKLVGDMTKLREENKKLADEAKHASNEATNAHHSMTGALREQLSELRKTALGYASVEKGVEFVSEAYGKWRAKLREIATEHRRVFQDLIKDLADYGMANELPKIKAAAEGLEYATPEAGLQAIKGIASVPGVDPSVDRRIELMRESTRTSVLGLDQADVGRRAGIVSKYFPKKSANDVLDITMQLKQLYGADFDALAEPQTENAVDELVQSGATTTEGALGIMAAAKQKGVPTRGLHGLASAVTKKFPTHHTNGIHPLDPKQRAENEFDQLDPGQRLVRLLNDPKMAQNILENRDMARLGTDLPDQLAHRIRSAGPANYMQQQLDGLDTTEEGLQQRAYHEAELRRLRAERKLHYSAAKNLRADEFVEARMTEEDFSPLMRENMEKWQAWAKSVKVGPEARTGFNPEFVESERRLEEETRKIRERERAESGAEAEAPDEPRGFWDTIQAERNRRTRRPAAAPDGDGYPYRSSDAGPPLAGGEQPSDPTLRAIANSGERTARGIESLLNNRNGRAPNVNTHVEN